MLNNVESVVAKQSLCCSCGLCASYCHQCAITYRVDKLGFYIPSVDVNKCNDCGLCVKCCPGKNDLKNYEALEESYLYGYSMDEEMRMNASSGGLATELLCYLIENKIVDYVTCVTNRTSSIPSQQILTNDISKIRESRTSKYCPVRWNDILLAIEKVDGSVAVMALPCQINSLKKYFKNRNNNIKHYISLFCNHTPSLYAADYLASSIDQGQRWSTIVNRGGGFPGFMKITLSVESGSTVREILFPFRRTMSAGYGKFFKNMRCVVCNDPFAKNADIVMGDSYFLQESDTKGTTFCIVRNKEIESILYQMKAKGKIDFKIGPSEIEQKKAFRLLFNREKLFPKRLEILKKLGIRINSPLETNNIHFSFMEVMKFKREVFLHSLGRYHFLWNLLAKIMKVKKLAIEI